MNKIVTLILVPTLSLFSLFSYAQSEHEKCGINHYMNELYKTDPDLKKRIDKQFETRASVKSGTVDTTLYIIPVVFHILHEYGMENISDAQVLDEIRILNEDYRLKNADTADVVSAFDTVMADAHIEFRLATKDPWGNCTNGIEHIYSHELNTGDINSKLSQWNRSLYLNVWVCKSFPQASLLGYSMYPEAVEGTGFYYDGIILKHSTIGTIGTASGSDGRTLTHEAGHWLNLSHTWGNTNDPGVECGDDGVEDTPETKGSFSCDLNASECNSPIIENRQNYMEYAACSNMFTKGQVERLRAAVTSDISHRSTLITDSAHVLTGINEISSCPPKADFYASDRFICQGSNVTFNDVSWRSLVTSRTWTFEGGTPSTSTSASQSVVYDTPGYKKVTLSVQNVNGTDVMVQENYIYVSPLWADFTGPNSNDLEGSSANWFLVDNPENNYAKFQLNSGSGYNHSTCYKLNNYKNVTGALEYTNDWFYNKRLGNSKDILISPSFDLRNTTGVSVSFKYAYASNATVAADIEELFTVSVSKNCGETWVVRETVTGAELLTAGYAGYTDFSPATNEQWKTCTVNYTPSSTDNEVRFKIEFKASDLSSNFYVDNFNINGTLGLFANEIDDLELNVYPNPTTSQQSINVSYVAGANPVELVLRDIQGKVIYSETIDKTNAKVDHTLEIGKLLSASCYFLEVKSGDFSSVKKVVVL